MIAVNKQALILFSLILAILLTGCALKLEPTKLSNTPDALDKNIDQAKAANSNNTIDEQKNNQSKKIPAPIFWHLKDVPLDITDAELDAIKIYGFQVLMPEWGVGDAEINEVKNLLDRLSARKLKIVLDAGFSASALGFRADGTDSKNQKPVWQKDLVSAWINSLKNHPAVYGWDISNEAGENVPNGEKFKVSLSELKNISRQVRALDNSHPLLMRMHYWDEYDGDFGLDNPFDKNLADIVILNLYSNYSEDGAITLLPDMLKDSGQILINKIKSIDPEVNIWLSLAAFEDLPIFPKQTPGQLNKDITLSQKLSPLESLGFFGWGERDGEWYMPRDGQNLLEVIKNNIK